MKNIFILFLLLLCIYGFAQKGYVEKVNLLNKQGQKEGLWIEDEGLTESYYKNGIKSGFFKQYSQSRTLSYFGEYLNGEEFGTWYAFGDQGHLLYTISNFQRNTDEITFYDKKNIPEKKAYISYYYPNGNLKEEGTILFWDDFEIGNYRFGEWKYYDESGRLIEKKILK